MENMEKEIDRISSLFPEIDRDSILDYMRKIPKKKQHLRIELTLKTLFESEDINNRTKLHQENVEYAKLINELFPKYSTSKIFRKLRKYGTTSGRCKLAIRNIVKGRSHLRTNGDKHAQKLSPIRTLTHNEASTSQDNWPQLFINSIHKPEPVAFKIAPSSIPKWSNLKCVSELDGWSEKAKADPPDGVAIPDIENSIKIEPNSEECEGNEQTNTSSSPWLAFGGLETFGLNLSNKPCDNNVTIKEEIASTAYTESNSNLGVDFQNISEVPKSSPSEIRTLVTPRISFGEATSNETTPEGISPAPESSGLTHGPIVLKLFKKPSLVPLANEPLAKKRKVGNNQDQNLIDILHQYTGRSKAAITKFCIENNIDVNEKLSNRKMFKMIDTVMTNVDSDDETDPFEIIDRDSDSSSQSATEIGSVAEVVIGDDDVKPQVDMIQLSSNNFAAGATSEEIKMKDNKIVYRLMEIFPDADPNYIRAIYSEAPTAGRHESVIIDELIEQILEAGNDIPRRPQRPDTPEEEIDVEAQISFVSELLPDADPNYLRRKVMELSPEELKTFVAEALENNNYPSKKEYLRDQQLSAQMKQYTTNFSVENFVKLVPDPLAKFGGGAKPIVMDKDDAYYLHNYFRNKFDRTPLQIIQKMISAHLGQPYKCYNALNKITQSLKSRRAKVPFQSMVCKNIPLLQEIAFIEHEKEILDYLNTQKMLKEQERIEAKRNGVTVTCNCCFDDEVLPGDSHTCNNNCVFCKACIIKSTEVAFGEGKLEFPCLGDCGSDISLRTLQDVLPPNLFSKIAQKKAVAEVKAAGIEDLESCPFCDFATIPSGPPETNKIFTCLNPDCMKESCRLCKEPSHVPLRCDEVEKDEDVKKRVFIENKMTEALLRKCWKCGVSFYKEEGCNKMTCSCGATMCYICKQPVTDYKHFNGIGGDRHDLCPLYSDNIAVNQQNVLNGALAAKQEMGIASSSDLKIDPTADVDKYFKERSKQLPREAYLDHLQRLNPGAVQMHPRRADAPIHVHQQPHQHPHQHHHHHHRVQGRVRPLSRSTIQRRLREQRRLILAGLEALQVPNGPAPHVHCNCRQHQGR